MTLILVATKNQLPNHKAATRSLISQEYRTHQRGAVIQEFKSVTGLSWPESSGHGVGGFHMRFHILNSAHSLGTRLPYPKREGESSKVAYRKQLWATACMRIPKCQLKVIGGSRLPLPLWVGSLVPRLLCILTMNNMDVYRKIELAARL